MASESASKCMKCGKPATHKITKIVKGKVYDLLLCEEHAHALSPYIKQSGKGNLVELLHQILKQQEQLITDQGPACPNCGLHFGAYRKTLLLGCSECYASFGNLLEPDLRKMHGVVSHEPEDFQPGLMPSDFPDVGASVEGMPDAQQDGSKIYMSSGSAVSGSSGEVKPFSLQDAITVDDLRQQLGEAVASEHFDKAARLRDSIRLLESLKPEERDCDKCGTQMEVMHGPQGLMLGCPNPQCGHSRSLHVEGGAGDEEE